MEGRIGDFVVTKRADAIFSQFQELYPEVGEPFDRLAKEGALFTDVYAQQSCTAGRSSFILGEHLRACGGSTIVLICGG